MDKITAQQGNSAEKKSQQVECGAKEPCVDKDTHIGEWEQEVAVVRVVEPYSGDIVANPEDFNDSEDGSSSYEGDGAASLSPRPPKAPKDSDPDYDPSHEVL